MAEFKVNPQITSEIQQIRSRGTDILIEVGALDSSGVSTLNTAVLFIEQHEKIKTLLRSYKALITKDTADLDAMVATAQKMDQTVGKKMLT